MSAPHPARRGATARTVVATLAALAALLVGCTNPFASDRGPSARPASLVVHLHLGNIPGSPFGPYSADSAWMRAIFDAGLGRGGTPRSIDAHLHVEGSAVIPATLSEAQVWYDAMLPAPPPGNGTPIVVHAPAVRGVTPTAATLRLRGLALAGPDTIDLPRGEELRLLLHVPAVRAEPAPLRSLWRLQLSPGAAAFDPGTVELSGTGMPPAVLRVPASLLPAPVDGGYTVTLTAVDDHTYAWNDAPAYGVGYIVQTTLRWTVRVPPVAAAGGAR